MKNALVLFLLIAFLSPVVQSQTLDKEKVVAGAERAWEKNLKTYVAPGPGCVAAVALDGQTVFEKGYGMAELEHDVPITPQTVFESGSVAKQFTAAALVLLQQDGKLSIDDPVRKYIPELPDYGSPLTIRHMLNHTAGLRDWGSVMELTGAGRGDRVINQDIALDVVVHQKALDFKPGDEYSYSNSGYNLAAIIVERVSKQKFADFLAERLFKPLGMKNSSIRDDYQRLVPHRAQGYSRQGPNGPWRLNMPIMNVYGNGGMLTTIGDWMKWNAMLDSRSMGASLVEALETQGILNDGRKISYALGLDVGTYKGLKEVSHSGGTAGYQTFLARYPEKKLSVGALCNGFPPFSGDLVHGMVDEILGPFPEAPKPPDGVAMSEEELKRYAGIYSSRVSRNINRITFDKGELKLNSTKIIPLGDGKFVLADGAPFKFVHDAGGKISRAEIDNTGTGGAVITLYAREEWTPTDAELASFAGDWYSDEARTGISFKIEGGKAYVVNAPTIRLEVRPIYKDSFSAQGGYVVWFTRDAAGRIDKMHVTGSRMRDMPFTRMK